MIPRRSFLKSAAALSLYRTIDAATSPVRAYVGAYGSPDVAHASAQSDGGIFVFDMDRRSGELGQQKFVADSGGPSWFAVDRSKKFLYVANETAKVPGVPAGSVSAYGVNATSGDLTLLNTVSSGGRGPVYISLHPSGQFLFVANYAGGSVAVFRVEADGKLGGMTDRKEDAGTPGSNRAVSGPPGSFAISGHERPHAHMVAPDPAGRFVLSTDLALDRLYVWRLNTNLGTLGPNDPPFITFPSGDGPRHFQFHPTGRWLYSLQEESSTLAAFDYDAQLGKLALKQTLSTLPKGFTGTSFASELLLSKDGRFAYAGNRLHDSIACFAIGKDGKLTWLRETWTAGDYPRNFSFDPSGAFLFSCNQRGDALTSFRVNKKSGELKFTGQYTPVAGPAAVLFL